ncbi:MAG: OmpA family protein [Acidobacteria bacterium]|nr:OmpA family protein [Acidobacteriota bacterium]
MLAPGQQPASQPALEPMTTFKVNVVSRSIRAVNYRHRGGATTIDFIGTAASPNSSGKAKVESKQGYIEIDANFQGLAPAHTLGAEYLTYVLWAITADGRPKNLGEVLLNSGRSKLNVTTDLQVFGLIITAEPYFAVTQPSEVIVLENEIRPDTTGKWEVLDAKYELLQRGQYAGTGSAQPPIWSAKIPLELIEARNAVRIAKLFASDKYAADTYKKAADALQQAENYLDVQAGAKPVSMMSREAVQRAEDARVISLRRQDEERLAQERKEAAEREAAAKAATEAEAQRRAQAEADRAAMAKAKQESDLAAQKAREERAAADAARLAAEQAKAEADKMRAEAEASRRAAEEARKQAEAAKAEAIQQQQALALEADRAKKNAEEANRLRMQAEAEKAALRQQLRDQLNAVLETRDSARGLIVNMSDVLFEIGKYNLKPDARERLARVAGIMLAHPSLRIEVEGHTDNVGGDEYNQKLSEDRANSVREFMTSQGLKAEQVTARGFGKTQPTAPNTTAAGRKQNRRVELVVSGEAIESAKPAA